MSTYLIGDIQGCYDPLCRLLERVKFDPAQDRIWSCGDLVNRGGQSLEVLRLMHGMAPRVSVTLGNHDLALLALASRHSRGGSDSEELDAVLTAPDREPLLEWLSAQPLAAWSNEHRLLRVHAGVVPAWDWRQTLALASEVSVALRSARRERFLAGLFGNSPRRWRPGLKGQKRLRLITNVLTRLRFCDAAGRADFTLNGPPGSQPPPLQPWFRHRHRATRGVRVAFGHWAALGLKIRRRYLALDSGYVWGGELSAYRLEDGELFQVPARAPGQRRNA